MRIYRAGIAAVALFAIAPIVAMPNIAAAASNERTLSEAPVESGPVRVTFDRTEGNYAIGEVVGLFIEASESSHVTVLNISPSGAVTKLFPNKYQTNDFVEAGSKVQVPDPASGAKLEVSGPVGKEQIRIFYSEKPLSIFADLGGSGAGIFRSIDGGMDEISRSVDNARSLGSKIGTSTITLTTVEKRAPDPVVAAIPKPAASEDQATPEEQAKPEEQESEVKPTEDDGPALDKSKKQVKPAAQAPVKKKKVKVVQPAKRKPGTYKIVTNLKPGQVLADDEVELLGKVPDDAMTASTRPSRRPHYQQYQQYQQYQDQSDAQSSGQNFQMPQLQMPQIQMPQIQMPQIQMPQIQMPQLQLPQLQLPQFQLGRSAEAAEASTDPCAAMLEKLNAAVSARNIADASLQADAIAVSADCGQYQIVAQRRVAALQLTSAQEMMTANRPSTDYEPLLIAANRPQVLWQASATLAEFYFNERRFVEAAGGYEQAIEVIKNETRTPKAPDADTIKSIIDRAGQARILAANPTNGTDGAEFVPVEKDHRSGMLGGIYSSDVRGIVPVSIPVPITFEFNKSTFTSIGEQAAGELLEAIKEQRPERIVLIGHTDKQGSDDYNQKLSVSRAKAVADFLKKAGIDASIEAEGRGSSQPVDLGGNAGLTEDDIDALNRRVEWRRAE